MKKLIVAAMMVLGTTSAFAGDSDAPQGSAEG